MSQLRIAFGRRIKQLRQSLELTQEDLAEQSGLSIGFVGGIERGIKSPTIDTLQKLAIALEVTLSELMTFEAGEDTTKDSKNIQLQGLLADYADKIEQLYKK